MLRLFKKDLTYKDQHSVEQRVDESNRILAKHPNLIPIIIDCDEKLGKLKKNKFLCPSDISFSQFLFSVRRQLTVDSSQALFAFCDNKILCTTSIMSSIYQEYIETKRNNSNIDDREKKDRFLYLKIYSENTFGM